MQAKGLIFQMPITCQHLNTLCLKPLHYREDTVSCEVADNISVETALKMLEVGFYGFAPLST